VHVLGFQKILGYLLMPVGLFWLGLLAACLWCGRRKQRGPAIFLAGLWLFYTLAGNRWVGLELIRSLERRIPQEPPPVSEPFDAVCVLGGGSELDPARDPELGDDGDRIAAAARLWRGGHARLLVASGTSDDDPRGSRNLGEETRHLWAEMGVPPEAILVVSRPCRITREEIAAYRSLQMERGWKRVAVLSSARHLPRILALAHRAGLEATPIGADWRGRDRAFQSSYLVPQARGFTLVESACWEYLGRWVGR